MILSEKRNQNSIKEALLDRRTIVFYKNKLIGKEAIERAKKQSIGSGLITGLASYLAQPKNQGYGDSTPYLAKAFLNAN